MKKFQPVYYITSSQKFVLEEAISRLKNNLAESIDLELNCVNFEVKVNNVNEVVQAASTLPFFVEKKLIILYSAEKLNASEEKVLIDYLQNPAPSTILVLVSLGIAKNSKLLKEAQNKKAFYEYKTPKGAQYPNWIINRFKSKGKTISFEAAQRIQAAVGSDLFKIDNEILKIVLFYQDKKELSLEDVSPLLSDFFESTIFDLVDSLGQKNLNRALKYLDELFYQGEKKNKILFMIVRQFRLLIKAKQLSKASSADLAKNLGLPPFIANKYLKQSENFSQNDLKRIFSLFLEADLALKTSLMKPRLVLEVLLSEILRQKATLRLS